WTPGPVPCYSHPRMPAASAQSCRPNDSAHDAAALRDLSPVNVRYGSGADITRHLANVRFTSQSGHRELSSVCPLSAKSGHNALQQTTLLINHLIRARVARREGFA